MAKEFKNLLTFTYSDNAMISCSIVFLLSVITYQTTLMQKAFVAGSFLSMHSPFEWSDPQVNGLTGYKQSFGQQWHFDAYQQLQWPKEENHFESATIPDTTHPRNNSSPDTGMNEFSSNCNH